MERNDRPVLVAKLTAIAAHASFSMGYAMPGDTSESRVPSVEAADNVEI
jgi:hypothetical protein